jgi:N-acetylmuramoyl-L-alanine amidase
LKLSTYASVVAIESRSPQNVTRNRLSILRIATVLLVSAAMAVSQTPPTVASPPAQAFSVQPPPTLPKPLPPFYRNLIVLDPAHGGPDRGAQLAGAAEKDVTLGLAQRLRPALVAQGFTVVSTRDSDPVDVLSSDQRAGTANHTRPLACLILHATTSGSGIHIATPDLERNAVAASLRSLRWNEAQTPVLDLSLRLANEIGVALSNAHLPVVLLRASVPPIDNLTCAATVIEISPLPANGSSSAANDSGYQQRVAEAIATGLASFRTRNAPPPSASNPAAAPAPAGTELPKRPSPAAPAESVQPTPSKPSAAPPKGER